MPLLVIAALLGWIAGGLVNYLADVLPRHRRLAAPSCWNCAAGLPWMSYLVWPRRCPACGRSRPWRLWLVHLAFLGATVWLWQQPPAQLGFPAGFLLLAYLGLVTVIDLEHRLILHRVSLAGALIGLVIGAWTHGILSTLAGGLAGFAGMFALYLLGVLFVRLRSGRAVSLAEGEALGFGDVTFSGVLGLVLGWPGILAALFLAILLAGLASLVFLLVVLLSRRYRPNLAIPYGPFLALSAILLLYFRDGLIARLAGM